MEYIPSEICEALLEFPPFSIEYQIKVEDHLLMWMNDELSEHEFTCPYCWEYVTMLLDASQRSQSYIEDCEVCCNPIQIKFEYDRDAYLVRFEATRANG